ncbi:9522_t:CDS:1 [Racocetra fulgida]|uniref:9522_t:CDS:1 n=1 Tax=Racocetra fulgida TaxID=60492 RepID=A0A9N8WLX0_9GLOM|nr:9522_t:CDS:1 [Racocetra fulgida]
MTGTNTTNNISFELTKLGTAINMSFKLTEIGLTSNLSCILTELNASEMPVEMTEIKFVAKETADDVLQLSETAREHQNCLARERYVLKMAQNVRKSAVENIESTCDHKNQLKREAYA